MALATSISEYLLDTNVLSEWVKPEPNPGVVRWLANGDEDRVYLSVASLAEIRHGIELMPLSKRRVRLSEWLVDDLTARFEERVLDIDRGVAETWGILMARARRAGRSSQYDGRLLRGHRGTSPPGAGHPKYEGL